MTGDRIAGSIKLVKTRSISSRDVRRMVDLILIGISQYISSPLLRYSKTKSVSNKSNNFVLLRDEDTIVGFGMYRVEKNTCIIYEIHVDASYRSTGCGTALMEEMLEDLKGRTVVLFVHRKNFRAQRFYRKFGFELQDSCGDENYFSMHKHSQL